MDKKLYRAFMIAFILLIVLNIILLCIINEVKGDLEEYKKWEKIQINSLWDNVYQLQEEYSKIIDIIYKPYFNMPDNVGQ